MKVWMSFAQFEASAMDVKDLDLPEENVQEDLLEQKKLCLQRARSKQSKRYYHFCSVFCFVWEGYSFLLS